jgi:hypothetical protein
LTTRHNAAAKTLDLTSATRTRFLYRTWLVSPWPAAV